MRHNLNSSRLAAAGLSAFLLLGGAMPAGEAVSAPATAPVAKGFTPPPDTPVIPWLRFSIQYAVRILGSDGPTSIVFYITDDGGATWRFLGEDPDKRSPMMVTVPGEGTYGFATVVVSGQRQPMAPRPGTHPDKFVIVDRTPPTVSWLSPVGDKVKATENGILLEWLAQDPHMGATPVTIEYSTDGGKLWLPVRQNLPAKGSINWQMPTIGAENLQLRIVAKDLAGNTRIVRNQAKISVDRTPPTVRITAPDTAGKQEFDVYYEAEDESGVASVELYYTNDHGNTWAFYNAATSSPIHFVSPLGGDAVGLYLTASDRRGNRTPAPKNGTPPMKVIALDNEKPVVRFLAPFNAVSSVIEAKKPVSIGWETQEANPEANSAYIEYSLDGGKQWYAVAQQQPVSGSYSWTPNFTEPNVLLRVTVSDKYGNKGVALSQTFSIDGGRPDTRISAVKPVAAGRENLPPVASGAEISDLTVPQIAAPADIMTNENEKIGAIDDNALDALPIPGGKTPAKTSPAAAKTTQVPADSAKPAVTKDPVAGEIPQIPVPTETGLGKAEQENKTAKDDLAKDLEALTAKPAETPKPADNADKKAEKDPFGDFGNIPAISGDISQTPPPLALPGEEQKTPAKAPKADTAAPVNAPAQTAKTDSGIALPAIPSPQDKPAGLSAPKNPVAIPAPSFDATATLAKANAAMALPGNRGIAEAEKLAQEVITQDPNNAAPYAVMAQIRTKQGKFAEAVNFANSACRLAPGDFGYLEILGYAEYTQANNLFMMLRSGKVPAGQQQAVSADMVKALNSSETTYLQLLKSPEKSKVKNAYFRLGHIDYFRGTKVLTDDAQWMESIRKAIVNYQKAGEINEPAYREVLQIGICNYRLRDYDQAERWLERAIEVASNDRISPKEAYYYLASIHEKLDRPQQALEYWEKVAKEYPAGNQFQRTANDRIAELKALKK